MPDHHSDHRHQSHSSSEHPSHMHHKQSGPAQIGCMVITCSDSRTVQNDSSGKLIQQLLADHGHRIIEYHLIKDEPSDIQQLLTHKTGEASLEAIIINGGTGISRRDSTFEVIDGLLEKRLDGFGELFRYLSYKDIGSPAMLSRSTAGLFQGKVVFSIPGSEGAVRLAMEQLILPEIGHIVGEMKK